MRSPDLFENARMLHEYEQAKPRVARELKSWLLGIKEPRSFSELEDEFRSDTNLPSELNEAFNRYVYSPNALINKARRSDSLETKNNSEVDRIFHRGVALVTSYRSLSINELARSAYDALIQRRIFFGISPEAELPVPGCSRITTGPADNQQSAICLSVPRKSSNVI